MLSFSFMLAFFSAQSASDPQQRCRLRSRPSSDGDDFYAVLGVTRSSDHPPAGLKKAYRRLALEWHPDKVSQGCHQDKATATSVFEELARAYRVLSDPELREIYDRLG